MKKNSSNNKKNSSFSLLLLDIGYTGAINISVDKAHLVTQTVCKKLYGIAYQLVPAHAESLTKPRSAADYEQYKYVLLSSKSVRDYKHKNALAQEIKAAELIVSKRGTTKLVLHYDST